VSTRNATSIFAPLWVGSLFLGPKHVGDSWEDVTWVAIGAIFYAVAVVVVIPAFAFTLGRWIDKKTWRSTRRAVTTFGYYGLAWGVVAVGVYGLGGATGFWLLLWLLIPAVAAAISRLLVDVRSVGWTIVSWTLYVLAVFAALYLIAILLTA
jgi:hypothetical protein